MFALIPAAEIRVLREECPSNLATLCYKAVEQLVHAADSSCATQLEHTTGDLSKLLVSFFSNKLEYLYIQLSTVLEFLPVCCHIYLKILTGVTFFGQVYQVVLSNCLKMKF